MVGLFVALFVALSLLVLRGDGGFFGTGLVHLSGVVVVFMWSVFGGLGVSLMCTVFCVFIMGVLCLLLLLRPLVCEGGCGDTAIAALPHFLAHP